MSGGGADLARVLLALTRRREALGRTQEEVAHAVGHARQAVSQWETCRTIPSTCSIFAWAARLDMELVALPRGELARLRALDGGGVP